MHKLAQFLVLVLVFTFAIGCGEMPTDPMVDDSSDTRVFLSERVLTPEMAADLLLESKEVRAELPTAAGKSAGTYYVSLRWHSTYRDGNIVTERYYYQLRESDESEAEVLGAVAFVGQETDNAPLVMNVARIMFDWEEAWEDQSRLFTDMFLRYTVVINTDEAELFIRVPGDGNFGDLTMSDWVNTGDEIVAPFIQFLGHFEKNGIASTSEVVYHPGREEKHQLSGVFQFGSSLTHRYVVVSFQDLQDHVGGSGVEQYNIELQLYDVVGNVLATHPGFVLQAGALTDVVKVPVQGVPVRAFMAVQVFEGGFVSRREFLQLTIRPGSEEGVFVLNSPKG